MFIKYKIKAIKRYIVETVEFDERGSVMSKHQTAFESMQEADNHIDNTNKAIEKMFPRRLAYCRPYNYISKNTTYERPDYT